MSLIFVSHSSRDNAFAAEVRQRLTEHGHRSVFLDFDPADGIPAGRSWEQEIYRNIRACRAVIVLCSRHSMDSKWCFMEITHARALGKHLFPIKIDDCEIDGVLTDRQVIDLTQNRDEGFQRLARGILAAGLDPTDSFHWDGTRQPYPGLLAFQEADAAVFFGRDQQIGQGLDLLNRVRRLGQAGLVMVLGASGTGKSSLVRAGLLPRLRRDVESWSTIDPFRPRDDPALELAAVLSRSFERLGGTHTQESVYRALREAMERDPPDETGQPPVESAAAGVMGAREGLLEALSSLETELGRGANPQARRYLALLRSAIERPEQEPDALGVVATSANREVDNPIATLASDLRLRTGRSEARVLLIVDQFEELLGHAGDSSSGGADRFLALLRDAIERPNSPLLVLGTMRSDYLGHFQRNGALLDVRYESLSLGPMSAADIAQVIEKPARVASIDLEPGLAQALLEDAKTEDALPLLAFTLRELCERYGQDGRLKVEDYRVKLGGLQGAVAQAADDVLDSQEISEEEERLLRAAFLKMVRVTDGDTYARRTARWKTFDPRVRALLERFVQARLLVSGGDGDERTLEVAHEAIFRSWERLRHWLDERKEVLRLSRELHNGARAWAEHGRKDDDLWRGARVARARELRAEGELELHDLEEVFVESSHRVERAHIDAEELRRKRELRRARLFAAAIGVAFLVAVGLGIFGFLQRARALTNLELAEASRAQAQLEAAIAEAQRLTVHANLALGTHPQRAVLLSTEAVRRTTAFGARIPTVEQGLRDALAESGGLGFGQHATAVDSLGFSADGLRLATRSHHSVRLWDVSDAATVTEVGELTPVEELEVISNVNQASMVVSGDGRWLFTGSSVDGSIRRWDLAADDDAREPLVLHSPADSFVLRGASRDGRYVVAESFSAMGAGGRIHDLLVWDLAADSPGSAVVALPGHEEFVGAVAFSADGRLLVSGSWDRTVRLWNLEASDPAATSSVLVGHTDRVESVAITPDDSQVVTGGRDGTVRIWDPGTAAPLALVDARSIVTDLAVSHDGVWLAAATTSGLRVWDLRSIEPAPLTIDAAHDFFAVAFDPTAPVVAAGGRDGRVRLLHLDPDPATLSPFTAAELGRHEATILELAFSPDGARLASGHADGTLRLWDVAQPTAAPPLPDLGVVVGVSPDGRWLAAKSLPQIDALSIDPFADPIFAPTPPSEAARVRLFDLSTEPPAARDLGDEHQVSSLEISVDGRWLLIQALNDPPRLWDLSQVEPAAQESLLSESAAAASGFSANSRWLVTAGRDRVTLWNPRAPVAPSRALEWKGERASAAAVADDASWIAAGGYDGLTRLWRLPEAVAFEIREGSAVADLAFSPAGDRLAVASGNRVIVADLTSEDPSASTTALDDHHAKVEVLSFGPESRWLFTADREGSVRIWDLAARALERSAVELRMAGEAIPLTMSATVDGWLIVNSGSHLHRWPIRVESLLDQAGRAAGRNLGLEEWATYFPGTEYRPTFAQLPPGI